MGEVAAEVGEEGVGEVVDLRKGAIIMKRVGNSGTNNVVKGFAKHLIKE